MRIQVLLGVYRGGLDDLNHWLRSWVGKAPRSRTEQPVNHPHAGVDVGRVAEMGPPEMGSDELVDSTARLLEFYDRIVDYTEQTVDFLGNWVGEMQSAVAGYALAGYDLLARTAAWTSGGSFAASRADELGLRSDFTSTKLTLTDVARKLNRLRWKWGDTPRGQVIMPALAEAFRDGRIILENLNEPEFRGWRGEYKPIEEGDLIVIDKFLNVNRLGGRLAHEGLHRFRELEKPGHDFFLQEEFEAYDIGDEAARMLGEPTDNYTRADIKTGLTNPKTGALRHPSAMNPGDYIFLPK